MKRWSPRFIVTSTSTEKESDTETIVNKPVEEHTTYEVKMRKSGEERKKSEGKDADSIIESKPDHDDTISKNRGNSLIGALKRLSSNKPVEEDTTYEVKLRKSNKVTG